MLLNIWLMLFSIVIMAVDIKSSVVEEYVWPHVEHYVQFLGTVSGRGLFLVFCGLLACSMLLAGFWQEVIPFGIGALSVLVGMYTMVQGCMATRRFTALRDKLSDDAAIDAAFTAADTDESGELDLAELTAMCAQLGTTLSDNNLELMLRQADTDKSGALSLAEFKAFWNRKPAQPVATKAHDTVATGKRVGQVNVDGVDAVLVIRTDLPSDVEAIKEHSARIKQTPSLIRALNWLAAVGLLAGGIIDAVLDAQNLGTASLQDASQIFPAIINIWLCVFALLAIVLEGVPACGQATMSLFDEHCMLLETVWGRGVYYFFIGTLGIQLYQSGAGWLQTFSVLAGVAMIVLGTINMFASFHRFIVSSFFSLSSVEFSNPYNS